MHFFDTHIHLADFNQVLMKDLMDSLSRNGVERCLAVCAQEADWHKTASLFEAYPKQIIPAFAVHPWYASEVKEGYQERLEAYFKKYPQALVGECGFDRACRTDLKSQTEVFEQQFLLAKKYNRPMLVHSVKAEDLILKYLAQKHPKMLIHSFSGSAQFLKQLMNSDCYISVNAKFFNKPSAADLIRQTDKNRLLIETDAPYQSSVLSLAEVVQKIAQIRQESVENTAQILYSNAEEFLV